MLHQITGCRIIAPVEKGALALLIKLDKIKARMTLLVDEHGRGVDPGLLPARDDLLAERVLAHGSQVVHLNIGALGGSREIDGGIEGIPQMLAACRQTACH